MIQKYGSPEPVEPPATDDQASTPQGIDVTAAQQQPAPFDPQAVIDEGQERQG